MCVCVCVLILSKLEMSHIVSGLLIKPCRRQMFDHWKKSLGSYARTKHGKMFN